MAVQENMRGRNIGAMILGELERAAGARRIFLHARERAVPFYLRHGYTVVGPAPPVVGIPHFRMEKYRSQTPAIQK
jgi:predicted GNAT family N-acyltransferase